MYYFIEVLFFKLLSIQPLSYDQVIQCKYLFFVKNKEIKDIMLVKNVPFL